MFDADGKTYADAPEGFLQAPVKTIIERLITEMLRVEEFDKRDMRKVLEPSEFMSDQEFGLALHEAREILRLDYRIDFAAKGGNPYICVRASGDQIAKRAAQNMSKSRKARARGIERYRLAAEMTADDKTRARRELAAERAEERLIFGW